MHYDQTSRIARLKRTAAIIVRPMYGTDDWLGGYALVIGRWLYGHCLTAGS